MKTYCAAWRRSGASRIGLSLRQQSLPDDVPRALAEIDTLAAPSLTQPHWKEQFGRVLIEAMACGVPVVGSDSGEIPQVVGDAGLIVPEGDVAALRAALLHLAEDSSLCERLAHAGRARVLR